MEERNFQSLPLKLAWAFFEANGLAKQATTIRESKAKFLSYDSTLKRAMVLTELTRIGLLDRFIAEHWPYGGTPEGQKERTRISKIYERYQESIGSANEVTAAEEDDSPQKYGFPYEEHLRDFLAQNLELLEQGLKPWCGGDEDAVEFAVDGGRVDILGKDKSGLPVIIELKVSRGHHKTIGQVLYYRAKIKEMLKVDRVRIFIVALELTPKIQAAAREVADVSLFEYNLKMTIKPR